MDVQDNNQDARYSQAMLNKKETTEHQSSSGEVQKNLATRLAKPIEITPKNDLNPVEKTLVARGRVLNADIEKKKENGLQQEKNQFKRLERYGSDIQLKTVKEATHGEELVKNVGENGGRLAITTVVDIEDSDEDDLNSQEALNRKQTTSRVIVDNDQNRSSGACQTDLATTRMVGSTGIRKRQFASPRELVKNIKNVLDGLDDVSSSSSSSSSSSGEVDMDIPFRSLTSNKKMRTGATNL